MKVQKFKRNNIAALGQLMATRGFAFEESLIEWKLSNPGYVGWCLLDEDGELLSYYSLLEVKFPDQEGRVAIAVDAISHKTRSTFEHIFKVMNACFQQASEDGLELLLSPPTVQMEKVLVFTGWTHFDNYELVRFSGKGNLPLIPGHGQTAENEYCRWRWSGPRSYKHIKLQDNVATALRPEISPVPMLLTASPSQAKETGDSIDCCSLFRQGEAPENQEVLRTIPLYYKHLDESKKTNPQITFNLSLLEALALGW